MKPVWPNGERWNLLYSVETAKLRNCETAETCETVEIMIRWISRDLVIVEGYDTTR